MSGEYFYRRLRSRWGVWKRHSFADGCGEGEFVGDFEDREEARREVFRLNGWEYKPKKT